MNYLLKLLKSKISISKIRKELDYFINKMQTNFPKAPITMIIIIVNKLIDYLCML